MNEIFSCQYTEIISNKIWWNNLKDLPKWPSRNAVAEFHLETGKYCILKIYIDFMLHMPLSVPQHAPTLCNFREEMDADHIRRCSALKGSSLCDLYWQGLTAINAGSTKDRSPDLSPIENVVHGAQRLTQITPPAATPDQLWQRVKAAWSAVPQEHI
ncbi:hypothetical protein TNCV_1151531 [Trichonephila clavipes]|nr:hypothetical protein TNCV_1151531 [Trichonephila clavipes]